MKKEHDKTLRQRNPSNKNSDVDTSSSDLSTIVSEIQEKQYQPDHRQLALTIHNQHRIANRYISMERTMSRLDKQSRLLHERLTDKKKFGFVKESRHELKQAIQRHLEISAKFCA